MIITILWNLMITAGFASCVVIAAWIWFHFPDRTADDVVDFLLPVDLEKAGILLDATVVRALLVPALVSLFGRWNWWLPGWAAALLRVPPSPLPEAAQQ